MRIKEIGRKLTKDLNQILKKIVQDNGLSDQMFISQLIDNWEQIFEEGMVKYVKAKKIEDGILILVTNSSTWRQEIRLKEKEICSKINKFFDKEYVQKIKIRQY